MQFKEAFLKELKDTDKEHKDEILRVYSTLTEKIKTSTEIITWAQIRADAMNSKSLYETIGYCIIALQYVDLSDFLEDDKEKIKKAFRKDIYEKIGLWEESYEKI